jgi:hypothetical protein
MAGGLVLTLRALLPGRPVVAADRRNVRIEVEYASSGQLAVEGWTYGEPSTCDRKLATTLTRNEAVTFNPAAPEAAVWIDDGILVRVQAAVGLPQVTLRHGGAFRRDGCQERGKTVFDRKKFSIDDWVERVIDQDDIITGVRIEREPNLYEDILIRVLVHKH